MPLEGYVPVVGDVLAFDGTQWVPSNNYPTIDAVNNQFTGNLVSDGVYAKMVSISSDGTFNSGGLQFGVVMPTAISNVPQQAIFFQFDEPAGSGLKFKASNGDIYTINMTLDA